MKLMPNYQSLETQLTTTLGLARRPIAVSFLDHAPEAVEKFEGVEPAGCSFWRLAAEGRSFYTEPADHYNCPVGSYTHNIALPDARAAELEGTLKLMTDIGYLRMAEVPGIPRLPATPAAILYAPLGECVANPDVVLTVGRAAALMLLQEAAQRAGVAAAMPLLARPTCMAIPAAMSAGVVTSTGCIGNRVYTNIGDDELYAAIPGKDLERVCEALSTVAQANATLKQYHEGRQRQFATA
jgi:uncharacterized protein (DUF169 family)